MSKFSRFLALALALFATSYAAKADSFTGTAGTGSVKFTVDIYDVNSNAASNPFGLTQVTCRGGGPCGTILGGGFEVATVTFFSTGGFIINPSANAGNGGSEGAWENNTPTASSIFSVSGSSLGSLVAGTSEHVNPSSFPSVPSCTTGGTGWCFDGNDQGGDAVLTYVGNGVFTAADNSEEVTFSLPVPEPSILLMLGGGLLGLMGLGLRRNLLA